MTINTGWNIRIALLGERGTMYALYVGIIYSTVTASTYFGNAEARGGKERAG
ncbi:MAG: hypothetical protein ACXWNC_01055 [Anaerolineales bacterium]